MPVQDCQSEGEPGKKWGEGGTCYTYDPDSDQSEADAVKKALAQGIAIGDIDINGAADDHVAFVRAIGDVDLTPTAAMAAAAKKGLRLYEDGKGGDGLVPATIRDARRMAAREPLSESKVRRMPWWWARHQTDWTESDSKAGEETPGYVAALLWGIDSTNGAPGARWAARKVAEMDRATEGDTRSLEYRDDSSWATPRQKAIYEALEEVVEVFGYFDKGIGEGGVHYIEPSDNVFKNEGLMCSQCAFFNGGGVCELLAPTDLVEPDAVCKFWIIPDATAPATAASEGEKMEEDDTVDPVEGESEADNMEAVYADMRELAPSSKFELRKSGAGAHYRTLVGYAAVFEPHLSDDLGGFREKIQRGAFANALQRNGDVRLLFDHDTASVLARTANGSLELTEDDHGLRVWARVDMRDPDVARVAAKLANGTVDQMSFAFTVEDDEFDDSNGVPIRTIRQVRDIYEVSVVSIPAYPSTKSAILEDARNKGRLGEIPEATHVAPVEEGGTEPQNHLGRDVRQVSAIWHAKLQRYRKELGTHE